MALIIDAPMPKGKCWWHDEQGKEHECHFFPCWGNADNCPIIGEIPDKHGRIIDEKWVELYFGKYLPIEFPNEMEKVYKLLELALKDVPTILDASK